MALQYNKQINHMKSISGSGIVDRVINALPFELHLPGYEFCGPGTKLPKRLKRGDKGINLLDAACREHDIAYSENKEIIKRHQADKILENRAWERVLARDSTIGEKTNAYIVSNAMKAKVKLGMGIKEKNKIGKKIFNTAIRMASKTLKIKKPKDINDAIKIARKDLKKSLKGKKSEIVIPSIINVPKIGGFLPLVSILTALGALGGLSSGGAAIVKTINSAKDAKKQLEEAARHNKSMEAIAMGKGLFLKPYKNGYGLIVDKTPKN